MAQDVPDKVQGNVFVSYSRTNLDFASQIVSFLEDEGYDPRIDRRDIEATEKWRARLDELIAGADTVIIILSDAYLASEMCHWEASQALALGRRIIPVLPAPLTRTDVPDALAALNYIHFFNLREGDGTGFYAGTKALKRALRHDLERLRLRRRYEDRAAAWSIGEDNLLSGEQLVQALSWLEQSHRSDGVPPPVEAYIEASRQAMLRRERMQRRSKAVLTVLSVAALVATIAAGLSWWQADQRAKMAEILRASAEEARADLEAAKTETQALVAAAGLWANAREGLSLFEEKVNVASGLAPMEGPVRNAVSLLQQADNDRNRFKASETGFMREIANEITRDLAKAQFYDRSPRAGELIGEIFDNHWSRLGGQLPDAPYARLRLSSDYLSRALYMCGDNGEADAIRAWLAGVPEALGDEGLLRWSTISTRVNALAPGECEPARAAICLVVSDCPFAPELPQIADASGTFQITQLHFRITDESKRADVEAIARSIEERFPQYEVAGVELVKSEAAPGQAVRYYYAPQRAQAEALAAICAELAGGLGRAGWSSAGGYDLVSLEGRYSGLPLNRAEIWF